MEEPIKENEIRYCLDCGKPLPESGTKRRNYCNNTCRSRSWKARQRTESLVKFDAVTDDDIEHDNEVDLIRASTDAEIRYWKRRAQSLINHRQYEDMMRAAMIESIKAFPVIETDYQIDINRPPGADGSHTVLSLVSDAHNGEHVSAAHTGGISEYDTRIFTNRMGKWMSSLLQLVELRRSSLYIPNLVVGMLGDMVSGDIHPELVRTNIMPTMEQSVHTAICFAHALRIIARHFGTVQVWGMPGNHGRTTAKPEAKEINNSWDFLCYQMMATYLKDVPNIEFHIPKAFWAVVDVANRGFLMFHGDGVKGFSGYPWYGVDRWRMRMRDTLWEFDEGFDTLCMGHFHQTVRQDDYFFCNGSWKGGDEYSLKAVQAANRAKQTLIYVHENYGIVGSEEQFLFRATDDDGVMFPQTLPDLWHEG